MSVSKWFASLFGFGTKAEAQEINETVKKDVEMLKKSSQCGCGRSPTGSCLGLHKLSEEEWATHEVNPNRIIPPVVEAKPEVEEAAPAVEAPKVVKAPKATKTSKKTADVSAPKKSRAKKANAS